MARMASSCRPNDCQLQLLDAVPLCAEGDSTDTPIDRQASRSSRRDRVSVDLRSIGPRLRTQAARQGIAPAALLRKAALALLDDEPETAGASSSVNQPRPIRAHPVVKVTLRIPDAQAALLNARARSAEMAQGTYVCALIDGMTPAPLPADHALSVRALSASTDRLATLSADLNAFSRMIGRVPNEQLEPYRASLRSLVGDVRKHLVLSAVLIAELKPAQKSSR